MDARAGTEPLVVIVGPTASGKTALAIELAQKRDGEIVCADSRTVYKGLDIGTAKPTPKEQAAVPHHLLDVVEPDEPFTVADFKRLADEAIADIAARGKVPILVGGSGLYVDAVIYDYTFSDQQAPKDPKNPRHLSSDIQKTDTKLRKNICIIGLDTEREVLKRRITERVDRMIHAGFLDEVRWAKENYPNSKALDSTSYKAFMKYLDGSLTLDEAKALFVRNDYQLAKRQMTWFKRNNSIQWCTNRDKVVDIATTFLSKIKD